MKNPFVDSSISEVVSYLSLIFTTDLMGQAVDEKSNIIIRGREQLCSSLGARFDYYLNRGEIPLQWTDRQMFHRDRLNYLDKGASGLVFTKSAGSEIFVLKIVRIYDPAEFNREVQAQTCAARSGIAPKIFDSFVCRANGYGIIVMEFLKNYIPFNRLQDYPIPQKTGINILQQLFVIVYRLVNHCSLDIEDFQLMINLNNLDVKIIDFGLAKDISNLPNKKHIQDRLFMDQCAYFIKLCFKLLNDENWKQSWENVPSDETFPNFLRRMGLI